MGPISSGTDDIDISLIFSNAGYIRVGLFADDELEKALHNNEVNVVSALRVVHHFANRLLDAGKKGAICFTSSSSAFIPCPMSAVYGATKSFLTSFATSLAAELRPQGIHVMVVHPSPTNTNFYGNSRGMSFLQSAQKTAVSPAAVAEAILSSVGRTVIKDLGYFTVATRMLLKVLDYNFLSDLIAAASFMVADLKKLRKDRAVQKKVA
mmetsp:Transcript_11430/g.34943  ORF Transcript_11430/g.34943 Transcript_11430/m.34943 type:complete len:209 (-) Transcript_11430:159-785(-)